jgi:hypothetical protein
VVLVLVLLALVLLARVLLALVLEGQRLVFQCSQRIEVGLLP